MKPSRFAWSLALVLAAALHRPLAQEITVRGRTVEAHGFGTQGFIYTAGNDWLTMPTNSGSFQFTDFGLNLSSQLNSHVRVAVQGYDRELGQLGDWHPSLDWAVLDVSVKPWLSFRGGKVKTVLGLYNDKQDLDFANTYALLPQSLYPIDLRDATIAHTGGDIYGTIRLPHSLGTLQYTAYGGHRSDGIHSGYPYTLTRYFIYIQKFGGPVFGGDLRWKPPLRGLTVGISRLNEFITATGLSIPLGPSGPILGVPLVPYREYSKHDWANQFYGQYIHKNLHVESEYRRYYRDQIIFNGAAEGVNDVRGWYVAGGYRFSSWFEMGAYYSHYHNTQATVGIANPEIPGQDHDYDKVVTARFDLNRFTALKIEGHFMDGFGAQSYPNGFYPLGYSSDTFVPDTNALIVRTSFSF
jgi:hypothetical protein